LLGDKWHYEGTNKQDLFRSTLSHKVELLASDSTPQDGASLLLKALEQHGDYNDDDLLLFGTTRRQQ
jgi:hypothetical protein